MCARTATLGGRARNPSSHPAPSALGLKTRATSLCLGTAASGQPPPLVTGAGGQHRSARGALFNLAGIAPSPGVRLDSCWLAVTTRLSTRSSRTSMMGTSSPRYISPRQLRETAREKTFYKNPVLRSPRAARQYDVSPQRRMLAESWRSMLQLLTARRSRSSYATPSCEGWSAARATVMSSRGFCQEFQTLHALLVVSNASSRRGCASHPCGWTHPMERVVLGSFKTAQSFDWQYHGPAVWILSHEAVARSAAALETMLLNLRTTQCRRVSTGLLKQRLKPRFGHTWHRLGASIVLRPEMHVILPVNRLIMQKRADGVVGMASTGREWTGEHSDLACEQRQRMPRLCSHRHTRKRLYFAVHEPAGTLCCQVDFSFQGHTLDRRVPLRCRHGGNSEYRVESRVDGRNASAALLCGTGSHCRLSGSTE
eukprot:SAG31_NODE_591_length_13740_cov_11.032256_3_plen_426_part_00